MGMIILISWLVGWIGSIHPMYSAIMKAATAKAVSSGYSSSRDVERGDVVGAAAFATIGGAFWFVCAPYYLSHFIYSKRKPDLVREIEIFEDDEKHRRELKARLANAHKALDAAETKDVGHPGYPRTIRDL